MTSPCETAKVKVKVSINVNSNVKVKSIKVKVKSINHSDLDIGHALVTRWRLDDSS